MFDLFSLYGNNRATHPFLSFLLGFFSVFSFFGGYEPLSHLFLSLAKIYLTYKLYKLLAFMLNIQGLFATWNWESQAGGKLHTRTHRARGARSWNEHE